MANGVVFDPCGSEVCSSLADYLTKGSRATEKKNWCIGPEYLQSPEKEWLAKKGWKLSKFTIKEIRKKYVGTM